MTPEFSDINPLKNANLKVSRKVNEIGEDWIIFNNPKTKESLIMVQGEKPCAYYKEGKEKAVGPMEMPFQPTTRITPEDVYEYYDWLEKRLRLSDYGGAIRKMLDFMDRSIFNDEERKNAKDIYLAKTKLIELMPKNEDIIIRKKERDTMNEGLLKHYLKMKTQE